MFRWKDLVWVQHRTTHWHRSAQVVLRPEGLALSINEYHDRSKYLVHILHWSRMDDAYRLRNSDLDQIVDSPLEVLCLINAHLTRHGNPER